MLQDGLVINCPLVLYFLREELNAATTALTNERLTIQVLNCAIATLAPTDPAASAPSNRKIAISQPILQNSPPLRLMFLSKARSLPGRAFFWAGFSDAGH